MSASCPQLGFDVTFHVDTSLDGAALGALWIAFNSALAERGLTSGGGTEGGGQWRYIIWRDGSQAEHADRDAVREWAESRAEMTDVEVGDLIDGDFSNSKLDI
ncbi:MAG: 50S ribosome-binding protein YggL [Gemmatimonadaceae bacterium]